MEQRGEGPRWFRDRGVACFGLALMLRLAVVVWAAGRFPPAADGAFYQVVAERVARGLGYTWLWPDGAVTYAAHYPVGYPAILGGLYALFGAKPWVAMAFNACIGALAALAAQRIGARIAGERAGLLGGLFIALHPSLVLYTPALMTEGVVAAGILILAWLAVRMGAPSDHPASQGPRGLRRALSWLGLGLGLGLLCLVRPQNILLAPLFAYLALRRPNFLRFIAGSAACLALALLTTAPWAYRNCQRMDQCVWVSANGGWNLLIGAGERATGAWLSVEEVGFPEECKQVWGEAEKDSCFGAAAQRLIAQDFGRWVSLVPAKLAHTFDYGDAPGWYLSTSNPEAFPRSLRVSAFVLELLALRLSLGVLLFGLARSLRLDQAGLKPEPGRSWFVRVGAWFRPLLQRPQNRAEGVWLVLLLASLPWVVLSSVWPAYLGAFLLALGLLWQRRRQRLPAIWLFVWVLGTTLLVHAVFFGATRYGLITTPALGVAVAWVLTQRPMLGDTRA